MSKPNKNKTYRSLFLLLFCMLMFTALYGCGPGPDSTTPPGTTPTPSGTGSVTLSFTSSTVTFGTPVTAHATVWDGNGALASNVVVTFASSSGLVTFTPTSATALTVGGTATVTLNAASSSSEGAASITASASVTTGGTTATVTSAPVGISVGAAAVTLGTLTLGSPSISAYGTSSLSIPVLVGGSPATIPISVAFSSSCLGLGKATITTPVTSNPSTGIATSTYKDNNCATGTDVITATVTGDSASATITVAVPATSNIQFVSATPAIIGIKGSAAPTLPQSSLVKFKVVDSSNNGKAGVLVDFSLLPLSVPGGITLSAPSATSDANGEVTVSLNSGTIPTPVWVVATVHGSSPAILSQSNTLTITTGLPTQNFFSLSVQTSNIEGLNYDGVTSTLTIIASDRLGNPIPNGTVINFVTEGSQINPASCTTTSGTCTVTFTSSAFKPANGRVSILAYAVGEKSFDDANGNNVYDAGETFYDLGDLFVDANENGVWDAGETYYAPYAAGGASACLIQPAGTPLTGDYATTGNIFSKANTCNTTWGTNYVRRAAVIVLSSSYGHQVSPTTVHMANNCTRSFPLMLMDSHGNTVPAGTTVTTANNQVYYTPSGSPTPLKATVSIIYGTPVPSTNNLGGTPITVTVESAPDCVTYPEGTVDIKTTTLRGNINAMTVDVVNP